MAKLAPHDLRRTFARSCDALGHELEQIQFLLGARLGSNDRTVFWLQATGTNSSVI